MSKKLFVTSNNVVYDGTGTQVAANWVSLSNAQKKTLFEAAPQLASYSGLANLGQVKVYVYSTFERAATTCSIDLIPKDQIVTPHGLINLSTYTRLMSANVIFTTTGAGDIKIMVTPDLSTYYTYDFENYKWVVGELSNIHTSGIPADQLNSINEYSLFDEIGKIGFAYGLSIDSMSDTCNVDRIDLTVDANGSWCHATDTQATYKYQGNTNLVVNLLENGDYKINYQP